MPDRVVHADKQGNFLVKVDGRNYLAPQGTKATVGLPVSVYRNYQNNDQRNVRPAWSVRAKGGTNWTEIWTTLDPVVTKTPKGKEGVREIKRRIGGTNLMVVVSDGSGQHKLAPRAKPRADIYIAMNSAMSLTFTEWDILVKEIEDARFDAPLDKIRKEAELEAAMDEIRKKYLP